MTQRLSQSTRDLTLVTHSAEETEGLAERLGSLLQAGDVVALTGPLGSGKTCFVRGLARGLGIAGHVSSPTFILMRLHRGEPPLCHVDAYRLDSAAALLDLGLDDWLTQAVVAVEWADRVLPALPPDRIEVHLNYHEDGRQVHLIGLGERPSQIVARINDHDPGH